MARMLPDGRRLGAHLAMGDGLVKAADRAVEIGIDALQIFSDNPTAWQRRATPNPETAQFRRVLDDHDVRPLAIHGSYLINLAGWDDTLRERSIELLASELLAARRLGAPVVNIHTGSHRGTTVDAGVTRLVDGVIRSFDAAAATAEEDPDLAGMLSPEPIVALENASGGGWALGIDLPQWTAIARAFDRAGVDRARVGFCFDTAHLWGAGHDLADSAATDALLDGFDDAIGLDRLVLMHLNDTRAELGSRQDRHEHIGAGRIGPEGLAHLLTHPRLRGVTTILETPGMEEGYDAINVARVAALARGEPLAELPPEAFQLRGSRSRAATPRVLEPELEPDLPADLEAAEAEPVPAASPFAARP
jgi:deoxyribonuclease IV